MGIFGVIALVVNIVSALALIPHRTDDANVRAVWLFSRNDAIGNLAAVGAAGLVWVDPNAMARPGRRRCDSWPVSALLMGDHSRRSARSGRCLALPFDLEQAGTAHSI